MRHTDERVREPASQSDEDGLTSDPLWSQPKSLRTMLAITASVGFVMAIGGFVVTECTGNVTLPVSLGTTGICMVCLAIMSLALDYTPWRRKPLIDPR